MSFDANSLPRIITTAANEVLLGLMEETPNVVDLVCTVEEKSALKGTVEYLDSAVTLPRDFGGKAAGEDTFWADANLSSTNYDMLTYKMGYRFTEEEYEDLSQYMSVVDKFMPLAFANVETALSLDLNALLAAESNTQAAQNGAWDVETSTVSEDIVTGIQAYVPGADIAIVGANTAFDMMLHSDFKEGVSNFAGRGLRAGGDEALAEVLKSMFGFKEVHICRQKYNSANEGQTRALAYAFGDFFWCGFKSNLVYVKQKSTDATAKTVVDDDADTIGLKYRRVGDLIRPSTDGGLYFTGVGT
jgi:hypothetical protein